MADTIDNKINALAKAIAAQIKTIKTQGGGTGTITLSQPYTNFKLIRFHASHSDGGGGHPVLIMAKQLEKMRKQVLSMKTTGLLWSTDTGGSGWEIKTTSSISISPVGNGGKVYYIEGFK